MMDKEIWADVIGYEGLYKISNFGNVASIKKAASKGNNSECAYSKKILKQTLTAKGYLKVCLCKDGQDKSWFVHRLVLLSFGYEQPSKNHVTNHKNYDRSCNHLDNLEWATLQENYIHSLERMKPRGNNAIVPVVRTDDNKYYKSICEAGRENGTSMNQVRKNCLGKGKNRGKFKFALTKTLSKEQIENALTCDGLCVGSSCKIFEIDGVCQASLAQTALALLDMLKEIDEKIQLDSQYCPVCFSDKGHYEQCRFGNLLREAEV